MSANIVRLVKRKSMPRKCSVPGCKSNYDSETEVYTTFSLPKDEPLRSLWIQNIPTDFSKIKLPVICIKHFDDASIIRKDVIVTNGERKEYIRKIPKLIEGAVPSIFPEAPEHVSTPVPSTSKRSAAKEHVSLEGCEVSFREGLSASMEVKLIELARAKPALYDPNHPGYFKGKVKHGIWQQIAKNLNLPGAGAAKSTWEKLRNNHRDALRRQRAAIENGVHPRTLKKWRYQKEMEFLLNHMTIRPYDINLEDDDKSQQEVEYVDENMMLENLPIEDAVQDDLNTIKHADISEVYVDSPSYAESPPVPKDSIKRIKIQDDGASTQQQQNEHIAKKKKFLESDSPSDELYYFFLSMYKITKKMPPTSQHIVKKKIFEAVSEAEADLLNIEDISQHSYQYENASYITDNDRADSTIKILLDNA